MNNIKNIIHSNIYSFYYTQKIRHLRENRCLEKWVAQLENVDSIAEYDKFRQIVIDMKTDAEKKHFSLMWQGLGQETTFYGHGSMLLRYADLDIRNMNIILPCVEHGISWYERPPMGLEEPSVHSFFFQGDYRRDVTHKVKPYAPVFEIGPFIHYAQSIYLEQEIETYKKNHGKTALIFPFHCYEQSEAEYDTKSFVKDIMKAVKNYNNVLVSVYWNDVNTPVYDMFRSEGATLVSAGFRGDRCFIDRLKTLILMSDATFGNGLGTHIGYSMYLNRPHYMISSDINLQEHAHNLAVEEENLYAQTEKEFYRAFDAQCDYDSLEYERQKLFYKFWGGSKYVRSREEMALIIEILIDLVQRSGGYCMKYKSSIVDMLACYKETDRRKYELLKASLKGFD